MAVRGDPPIEEKLLMSRIPWQTFTMAELEQVAGMADRLGDTRLLTAVRRAIRARDMDRRPYPPDSGWK